MFDDTRLKPTPKSLFDVWREVLNYINLRILNSRNDNELKTLQELKDAFTTRARKDGLEL